MALNSLMTAYRAADYALALEETEKLKRGGSKTPEYCFYRGALLHKLGQFVEAEAILRGVSGHESGTGYRSGDDRTSPRAYGIRPPTTLLRPANLHRRDGHSNCEVRSLPRLNGNLVI